jgi:hypothetical protein
MKTENCRHPSDVPHQQYPSLSGHFGREHETSEEFLASRTPRPDAIFRIFYLRLIVVMVVMMIVAALVAKG